MGYADSHAYQIQQTSGKSTYQLSATNGKFNRVTVVSGSTTGFLNVFDTAAGLPTPLNSRVLASGVVMSQVGNMDFDSEANFGVYVEAYGPVNAVVSWN